MAVDRPVSAFDRISGLNHISVLKYIVRDQHAALREKSCDLWEIMDILSLCRIHKYKVIGARKPLHNFQRISL